MGTLNVDIPLGADHFTNCASLASSVPESSAHVEAKIRAGLIVREPIGVMGQVACGRTSHFPVWLLEVLSLLAVCTVMINLLSPTSCTGGRYF